MLGRKRSFYQALALSLLLLVSMGQRAPLGEDEISFSSGPFRPEIKFLSQANVVQVAAVVRDRRGLPVEDLTQQDFAVRDNRRLQSINSFSVERRQDEAPVPATFPASASGSVRQTVSPSRAGRSRYVVFFVDDAFSKFPDIAHVRSAMREVAAANLEKGQAGGDHFAIATESGYGTLLFTQDAAIIAAGLNEITPHPRVSSSTCPKMTPFEAYRISSGLDSQLLDLEVAEAKAAQCCPPGGIAAQRRCILVVTSLAQRQWEAYEAEAKNALESLRRAVQYAGAQPSERIVLLASAGFLSYTLQDDVDRVSTEALRSGVTINTLDAKGVPVQGDFEDDHPATESNPLRVPLWFTEQFEEVGGLQHLADDTGGTFFHGSNDLHQGVRDLLNPPQVEYLIGFSPTDLKPDGSRHTLSVEVLRAGSFSVLARQGYTAPPPDESVHATPALQEALRKLVLGDQNVSGIQATLTVDSATGLRAKLRVNPRTLPLRRSTQRDRDELTAVAVLLDANGNFVAGTQGVLNLNLKEKSLADFPLPTDGVTLDLAVPAVPGDYRLRVAVAEANKGLLASFTRVVKIASGG